MVALGRQFDLLVGKGVDAVAPGAVVQQRWEVAFGEPGSRPTGPDRTVSASVRCLARRWHRKAGNNRRSRGRLRRPSAVQLAGAVELLAPDDAKLPGFGFFEIGAVQIIARDEELQHAAGRDSRASGGNSAKSTCARKDIGCPFVSVGHASSAASHTGPPIRVPPCVAGAGPDGSSSMAGRLCFFCHAANSATAGSRSNSCIVGSAGVAGAHPKRLVMAAPKTSRTKGFFMRPVIAADRIGREPIQDRQPKPSSSATTCPAVPTGSAGSVGQERQHRRVAYIDMRERAPILGVRATTTPALRRPVAAIKDRVALDRRRPGIVLDQFGHRAALCLGLGLIVEILRETCRRNRLLAQHDAMIVGGGSRRWQKEEGNRNGPRGATFPPSRPRRGSYSWRSARRRRSSPPNTVAGRSHGQPRMRRAILGTQRKAAVEFDAVKSSAVIALSSSVRAIDVSMLTLPS